jgi:hypothetical protein
VNLHKSLWSQERITTKDTKGHEEDLVQGMGGHRHYIPQRLRDDSRVDAEYNFGVTRATLFAALTLTVLSGFAVAQRSATVLGTAQPLHSAFVHSPFAGQGRFPNRIHSQRIFPTSGFHRRSGYGSYFFPYYEPYWEEPAEVEEPAAQQPQIVVQRTPEAPIPKGQVIEISAAANASPAKVLPPTIFILSNGERLESRKFVLTANSLMVSIERQHRSVPLDQVDIKATIAANRDREIDLQIPDGRNEISLSF